VADFEAANSINVSLKAVLNCHAKSVAWTNRVIFPGIYSVSKRITVIWLFGQFKWPSCNKLTFFSQTAGLSTTISSGRCLSRRFLLSRREGGDVKHTPGFMARTCNPCLSWYHDSSWQNRY
jgi:hypothetical protein